MSAGRWPSRERLVELYDRHEGNVAAVARAIDQAHTPTHERLVEFGIHESETRLHDRLLDGEITSKNLGLEGEHVA